MAKITWREYSPGDEIAINNLYKKITGRSRSVEQFSWQWLEAPGGCGEIWLIEVEENGHKKLIGHHGLMPLRFTNKGQNLLFGKTENTMVDPDYRKKILYPRFEKRFLQQYESRFDATFSTMGPVAAIRQRKAMGYNSSIKWKRYFWPLKAGGGLALARERYKSLGKLLPLIRSAIPSMSFKSSDSGLIELSNEEARESVYFDKFWTEARQNEGVAPRRDAEDLAWRFWNNPYNTYKTYIFENNIGLKGYAIVNVTDPFWHRLDDVYLLNANVDDWSLLFNSISNVSRQSGALLLSFHTTEDGQSKECFRALEECFNAGVLLAKPLANMQAKGMTMPRRVSPQSENMASPPWNITPIIFEGRR